VSSIFNCSLANFGTKLLFYFCWIQVLVVQASEVPNDQKTVVQSDPTDATKNGVGDASAILSRLGPRAIHKSREIVAYDDLF
jgi:glycerate-2-kinase